MKRFPEDMWSQPLWIGTADKRNSGSADQRTSGPAHQRISRPADQRISGSADQRISGSADQRISGSADQRISGSADQRISGSADQRTSGSADQRTSGPADQRISGPADQRISGSADQRISGSADQRISGSADQRIRQPSGSADQRIRQPSGHKSVHILPGLGKEHGSSVILSTQWSYLKIMPKSASLSESPAADACGPQPGARNWWNGVEVRASPRDPELQGRRLQSSVQHQEGLVELTTQNREGRVVRVRCSAHGGRLYCVFSFCSLDLRPFRVCLFISLF